MFITPLFIIFVVEDCIVDVAADNGVKSRTLGSLRPVPR